VNSSISKTNLICSILKKELNKEQNEYNNISIDYLKNKIEMINKSNNQIKEISASAARWIKNSETEGDLQLLPLKFQDVINHITDSFNLIVENKNITLNFDCAKTLQSTILVNPEAFRNQVVNNIISNAIKFTHSGSSITIKSTIREKSLYLSIIDQGDGIEDKIMKNIYNPSKSISTNGTAGEIGTGLGMPIVKNFIERMGGSLAISSLLMSGTTTTLTVPLSR
jgi:signal transduction histidine kinase